MGAADEIIAWLLGVVVGDGHVDKYFVEISDKDYENLAKTAEMIRLFGFKAVVTKDKRENRYRLYVNTKRFVEFLKRHGYVDNLTVPHLALEHPFSFVRGLFDAEGYIEYWKPKRMIRINLSNKSEALIGFVKIILTNLSITPSVRHDGKVYRLQIYRQPDVKKYAETIGFWYPSKIKKLRELIHNTQHIYL